MLPVMVASGFSGPIADTSLWCRGLGCAGGDRRVSPAPSAFGLALTDFSTQQWLAWGDDAAGL